MQAETQETITSELNSTPARITDPAVGASTWASGNHVCTGHIGTFTAKEAKKASQSHV